MYKQYLLWGLKYVHNTYRVLFGSTGYEPVSAALGMKLPRRRSSSGQSSQAHRRCRESQSPCPINRKIPGHMIYASLDHTYVYVRIYKSVYVDIPQSHSSPCGPYQRKLTRALTDKWGNVTPGRVLNQTLRLCALLLFALFGEGEGALPKGSI